MTTGRRFVRIIPDTDPRADAGSRIRVDYDPDDTGAFCIADENVLPEKLLDPNCHRVQTISNVELGRATARSLRDALIDLCRHLDDEDARAVVAAEHGVPLSAVQVIHGEPEITERELTLTMLDVIARCPYGAMPRDAGAGHWRDWHRGHGCHLDPERGAKS